MFIILDMNVPLYNYSKNNISYSQLNTTDNAPWHTFTNHDIIMPSNSISELATLKIENSIPNNSYIYNISIPVGIYITGTIDPGIRVGTNIEILKNVVYINKINVLVYYNGQRVPLQQVPVIKWPKQLLVFDVSYDKINNSDVLSVFSYVGNINITNLFLYTSPGFIYDIRLQVDIGYDQIYNVNAYYPDVNYQLIANPSSISVLPNICCNIVSSPAEQPLSEFFLSAAT
jgi:hypothetical protein